MEDEDESVSSSPSVSDKKESLLQRMLASIVEERTKVLTGSAGRWTCNYKIKTEF